jgi:hypothetical protein
MRSFLLKQIKNHTLADKVFFKAIPAATRRCEGELSLDNSCDNIAIYNGF